jgi:hypothetical protein
MKMGAPGSNTRISRIFSVYNIVPLGILKKLPWCMSKGRTQYDSFEMRRLKLNVIVLQFVCVESL